MDADPHRGLGGHAFGGRHFHPVPRAYPGRNTLVELVTQLDPALDRHWTYARVDGGAITSDDSATYTTFPAAWGDNVLKLGTGWACVALVVARGTHAIGDFAEVVP